MPNCFNKKYGDTTDVLNVKHAQPHTYFTYFGMKCKLVKFNLMIQNICNTATQCHKISYMRSRSMQKYLSLRLTFLKYQMITES